MILMLSVSILILVTLQVQNDEEASLLMQHPASLSDSDDDLLI